MFRKLSIKFLLLFTFVCVAHIIAEGKKVVTEMQITDNDTIFRYSYLYDNTAQPVVETKAVKNGTGWENISQTEWFRQADLPAGQTKRLWLNDSWKDTYNIRYEKADNKLTEIHRTYTDNNTGTDIRKIETVFKDDSEKVVTSFDLLNRDWVKTLETAIFYNVNKQTDSTIVSVFNNNLVTSIYKTSYEYNPDETCKNVLVQTKSDSESVYSNVSKSVFSYKKGSNLVSSQRSLLWNSKSVKWENDTKLEYNYDASGNQTEEIAWEWNSMTWRQLYRYSYQYDAGDQLGKKLVALPLYRDWRNTNSVNYLRESESGNMTVESVYGFWGGKAGEKLNTYISFPFNSETIIRRAQVIQLTYTPFVNSSVGENLQNKPQVKVYPNPSCGIFYISNFDMQKSVWTITSLNGSVMKTSDLRSATSIVDISDLPNGVYMLKIQSNGFLQTQKLVKY